MPIYSYVCPTCGCPWEAPHPVDDRHTEVCPRGCPTVPEIQLFPVPGHMVFQAGLITETQCEAKYGKDWRETPGSRRMRADEPERLYGMPTKHD